MHLGIQDAISTTQFSGISGNKWTAFWELLKLLRALPDRRWLRLTSDITCNIKKQYHSEQYTVMIQGYLWTVTMQRWQSFASLEILWNMWNALCWPGIPDSLLIPPQHNTADTFIFIKVTANSMLNITRSWTPRTIHHAELFKVLIMFLKS